MASSKDFEKIWESYQETVKTRSVSIARIREQTLSPIKGGNRVLSSKMVSLRSTECKIGSQDSQARMSDQRSSASAERILIEAVVSRVSSKLQVINFFAAAKITTTFFVTMKNIYKLARHCKCISDEKMGTDKTLITYRNILFTDYTVKGAIDEYLIAIGDLCIATFEKYPLLSSELKQHRERFSEDKIVHFSALKAIVDSVLSIERESTKRVFISHSSRDRDLVERFVDNILQLGIGLSHEDIFCTSIEEMGVKNGEDIREHIRNNVQSADFSFLMISRHYKESEICLNEMGAVWAADNRVRYYLLPGVDFKEIGWLCDVKKADKLYDSVVLDNLESELMSYYDLPHRGVVWSRQRQSFLDYLAMK